MATAQETFRRMLRDDVAPALREMGFQGSGQTFRLPSGSHWALLGFQRSQWSDANEIRFTVNLTVVSRDDWAELAAVYPQLGTEPSANSSPAPIFTQVAETGYWHSRIGMLIPGGRDKWWLVGAGDDARDVARAIVDEIRDYALPAMRHRTER